MIKNRHGFMGSLYCSLINMMESNRFKKDIVDVTSYVFDKYSYGYHIIWLR
jgi:hypothetical protein